MSWRRLLYSVAFCLLLPFMLLRLLWRGRSNPAYYQRWPERFGFVRPVCDGRPVICLHAVSVGEVMAARPLVESLLTEFPGHRLWLSATTPTGSATVKRLFGGRVLHSYLPYDTPDAVARFLARTRPVLFLVMETELWPNLYAACGQRSIPLLLLNARLSARSVQRYQKISGLVSETLSHVTAMMARGVQDAERFQVLGAKEQQINMAGDIKFDVNVDEMLITQAKQLRQQWGHRPVWCAGSTHDGEDEIVLNVHTRLRAQFPDLLLILVPRHPERFNTIAALCDDKGMMMARRSEQANVLAGTTVLLGDSMGELLLWYASSDIAFIGGSLVPVGGHNPLEALGFGIPVLSGVHTHNFAALYPQLVTTGCAKLVESEIDLLDHSAHWLAHENDRLSCGRAGSRFLSENRGVVRRLLQTIEQCLSERESSNKNNNNKLN